MSLATAPFFLAGFNVTTIVQLPLRKMGIRDFQSEWLFCEATAAV